MQDGCFYFNKALSVQGATKTRNDLVSDCKHTSSVFVNNEICIALPIPNICVGKTVPFVWHWPNGLGKKLCNRYLDREFAFASGHNIARHADPVTEIESGHCVECLVSDNRLGHEELYRVSAILQGEKEQFALITHQHDAPSDAYDGISFRARVKLSVGVANLNK